MGSYRSAGLICAGNNEAAHEPERGRWAVKARAAAPAAAAVVAAVAKASSDLLYRREKLRVCYIEVVAPILPTSQPAYPRKVFASQPPRSTRGAWRERARRHYSSQGSSASSSDILRLTLVVDNGRSLVSYGAVAQHKDCLAHLHRRSRHLGCERRSSPLQAPW